MPVGRIEVENPTDYEAVDVIASSALKQPHKKYGNWMRNLAGVVREYVKQKGRWQPVWTVATRVFGLAYHGHTVDVSKSLAHELASEMGIEDVDIDGLVERIHAELQNISGERTARPSQPE